MAFTALLSVITVLCLRLKIGDSALALPLTVHCVRTAVCNRVYKHHLYSIDSCSYNCS
jgi:hypothetical protein